MSDDVLLVEVLDRVGLVTLNRPAARNALDAVLLERVPAALGDLDADDRVDVLVLTGSDPAFCAGLDLGRISSDAGIDARIVLREQRGPFPSLVKPLIGAINGAAVTGGLEYALACDMLVASERARFADTHARVGIMPGWGLTVNLAEAVGLRRARQLSFTGNFLDARTALAWGLVNEVVPHDELMPRTLALAADMGSVPQQSLHAIKAVYADTALTTYGDWWDLERARSTEWLQRFDPAELARTRATIQARGRTQAG